MNQTIRERLALADEANRRALVERMAKPVPPMDVNAHESDIDSMRSMSMLGGAIAVGVIVLFVAVVGAVTAWKWIGGPAVVASTPAGAECMR